MARAVTDDPYHKFRFHLVDASSAFIKTPEAGFTAVTMPDVSLEAVNYREGIFKWTQKFPGVPTVGEITMSRGIFRRNSDFHAWINSIVEGGNSYRTQLILREYHISDEFGIDAKSSRETNLYECFGTRAKPTSDKEAASSEIAIEELTVAVEYFDVKLDAN